MYCSCVPAILAVPFLPKPLLIILPRRVGVLSVPVASQQVTYTRVHWYCWLLKVFQLRGITANHGMNSRSRRILSLPYAAVQQAKHVLLIWVLFCVHIG